jgi:hypothetical protein
MPSDSLPPGFDRNPSRWPKRLLVLALAATGGAISTYLALYQLDILADVWEPIFGTGSHCVLKESMIARWSPVPDAAVGAVAYFFEAAVDLIGGANRWRTKPWAAVVTGGVAFALAAGGLVLTVCQPLMCGTFCTLCLASAVCSVGAALAMVGEFRAAVARFPSRPQSGANR